MSQVQATVESGGGEKKTGHELAGRRRVHLHRSAGHASGSHHVHGERAGVLDPDAQRDQRVHQGLDGPVAQCAVTEECGPANSQTRQRGEEPQHCAREAGVYVSGCERGGREHLDHSWGLVTKTCAKRLESGSHEPGVACRQHAA